MKQSTTLRISITLFFLLVTSFAHAQVETDKISLTFDNLPLETAIERIAEKSDYQLFYVADWMQGEKISLVLENVSVEDALTTVLENTLLNFYISDDRKIIITQNNRIYDRLPNQFFGTPTEVQTTEAEPAEIPQTPIFYNEPENTIPDRIETVRIGKEGNNSKPNYRLAGSVSNSQDNNGLERIGIEIEGTQRGTVTTADGSYVLQLPPGVYVLKVQALGFKTLRKRVVLYNDGQLNFDLNEARESLDEVFITGTVENAVESTDMGNSSVDIEEIKNIPLVLGERDVFKAVATLPGIASAGEGAAGYNVRGGSSDQNLILLDDAVIYNPAHFFGIFSAINPFTSKEITVYKGHIPANFGGRLSSVFDITTKNANVNEFAGEASIGPVTSSVVIETPLVKEKAAIMVGARGTYSDLILRNLDEEELRKSQANFFDVILKYNHKIDEKNSVAATGYYSRDAFSITSDSLYRYSNQLASLRWNHTFTEDHKGAVILSNSNYGFNVDFEGQGNQNFELGYTINESELKLNLDYKWNEKHQLKYGLASKLYRVQPGSINPLGAASIVTPVTIANEQALESAVFLSDEFEINEKLAVEGGIRLSLFTALGPSTQNIYREDVPKSDANLIESQEFGSLEAIKTYANPEFRLSSRYLLTTDFSVKASVNTQYQYLHRLTNNTTASPIDTWKLSDINIAPQSATQYAVGLFRNFKEGMYEASIEGYYKRSKNVLDYKVGAQLLLNERVEQEVLQGEGKAYGVELLLKKTKGKLNGWVGYTYARSFLKLDGNTPAERVNGGEFFRSNYDKPHDFSIVANYKLTKRFSFSGNFVYQTGRPVTVPIGNYTVNNTEFVLFSNRNEFRIPDYYRLDLGFNVEGNHKQNKLAHSFWNISVYNVLGRNNPYSVFFVAEDGDVKAYKTSIFSVPIPTISYNIKF